MARILFSSRFISLHCGGICGDTFAHFVIITVRINFSIISRVGPLTRTKKWKSTKRLVTWPIACAAAAAAVAWSVHRARDSSHCLISNSTLSVLSSRIHTWAGTVGSYSTVSTPRHLNIDIDICSAHMHVSGRMRQRLNGMATLEILTYVERVEPLCRRTHACIFIDRV